MARRVVAADGSEWRVGRRWLPWRVRLRRDGWDMIDVPADLGGLDDVPGVLGAILAALAIVVLLLVVWPIVALAVEVVALVIGVVVLAGTRAVLRRPWTVEAVERGRSGPPLTWRVAGWRASRAHIDTVAVALASGAQLPERV